MTAAADTTHRDNFLAEMSSAASHATGHGTGIEFHDVYLAAWAHQRQCSPAFLDLTGRPSRSCLSTDCLTRHYERTLPHSDFYAARAEFDVCRRWAWAVPNAAAITAIADAAPHGVVEIGAGGGYWAHELRRAGVDVTAYDPHPPTDPAPSRWHLGHPWADVHQGDHTAAANHPDRALLVCWPEPDTGWATDGITAYHAAGGRSVIYVGEEPDGEHTPRAVHAVHRDRAARVVDAEPVEQLERPGVQGVAAEVAVEVRV